MFWALSPILSTVHFQFLKSNSNIFVENLQSHSSGKLITPFSVLLKHLVYISI